MGWLVAVALGLAAALFIPGLLEQFEVPKTEAVRVCGLSGFAWGVMRGWPWRLKPFALLDAAVLAWLAMETAATAASVVPRLSVFGEPEQRDGLISSLALAGLYVAMRMRSGGRGATESAKAGARTSRDARSGLPAGAAPLHPVLEVFAAAMVFASLYAVLQATRNDPIPWTGVPIYGEYPRPGATFGHPNLLGVASAAAAALALAAGVVRRNPWWLAAAALFAVANALTLSRAAWLALIAAAPVALLLARNGGAGARPLLTRPQLFAAALGAVVVAGVLVAADLAEPLVIRLRELFAPLEGSGRSRLEIWRTALAAWQARPWLGQGPDTFLLVFPQFQTAEYWRQEWGLVPLHAHSVYLHVLATRGALGFATGTLLVAAIAVAAGQAWRRGERGLAAVAFGALVALGVGGAFGTPGVVGGALTMGIAGALAARLTPATTPPAGRAHLVVATLVGAAAFAWVTAELLSSHAAAHARLQLARDPRRAAALAERAERLAPYDDLSPSLRAQTALAIAPEAPDHAERLRDAGNAIARALAMTPQRSLHHQTQAYLLAASAAPGDSVRIAAAEAALARALARAPMDGRLLQQYADLELALGRPALAAVPAARAAQLYPGEASAQTLHAITRAALGDTAGARAALQRAIDGRWRDDGSGRMRAIRALEALSETP